VRRQLIAQIAHAMRCIRICWRLLTQLGYLANQLVYLLLLQKNRLIELIQQIIGKAGLDFELGQAPFGIGRIFHTAIRQELGPISCASFKSSLRTR